MVRKMQWGSSVMAEAVVVWCPGNRENGWNQLQAVTSRVSSSPDILPASKPCSLRFHSILATDTQPARQLFSQTSHNLQGLTWSAPPAVIRQWISKGRPPASSPFPSFTQIYGMRKSGGSGSCGLQQPLGRYQAIY